MMEDKLDKIIELLKEIKNKPIYYPIYPQCPVYPQYPIQQDIYYTNHTHTGDH